MFSRLPLSLLTLSLAASYVSAAAVTARAPVNARTFTRRAPGDVITKCTVPGTVALTFDDGPWVDLDRIVGILDDAGAKGTFYFNGDNFGCIFDENLSSQVLNAYQSGHQVASHTWGHEHLNSLTPDQVDDELALTEEAIYKITGAYPAFVRPPFGEFNQAVRDIAARRNVTITNWDFDSGDTAGPNVAGSDILSAYREVITTRPSHILTLMHEIPRGTIEILPQVIEELQAAGYNLVTVAECLDLDPYLFVNEPLDRDETWTCAV